MGPPRPAAAAADPFGRLAVWFKTAGVLRRAPFLARPVEEMREIFETNFWATVETVRAAAGVMEKQGGGPVSYTHLRAHETVLDLVCRLLLEKKNTSKLHVVY